MEALTITGNGTLQQTSQGIIAAYLEGLDVKPRSRETYRKALKHFTEWIAGRGQAAANRADILAYKAHLQAHYKATTISAYMTAVKGLYTYLEAEHHYSNIAAGIKGAKNSKGFRKDALTIDQTRALLCSLDGQNVDALRDFALVNLLVQTALRTIEVQRANIGDIRQEGGAALLYIQGKGRDEKDAFVLLTEATLRPLRAYFKARGKVKEDHPLFVSHCNHQSESGRMTTRSISRIVKEALKGAGMDSDRLTAHSLRHTAVTLSLLAGASIQEAQGMARHSNINTTLIYAHNIDRIGKAPERRIETLLAVS